jgi:hypothetical protein
MAINQFPAPDTGGIPSGDTASRPDSPVIGDTYYNGELELLEIYNGNDWVASSAPPPTPTIATPTDASTGDAYSSTAGKLSVVFTPGIGGSTATQYNAFTTADGHTASSSSTTVTISGLTPGTAYTVFGNAQNNFGITTNTENASAVTPTTLPQVPTIGTATTSSVTTDVTVTWTLGNNGGKNLSAITVTPFLNGTTAQTATTAATTSSTSATIVGLTQGSSYTFKVKTTNDNGISADSTATSSITIPSLITVDYLVVAGGGSGGGLYRAGGGGAGGMRCTVTNTGGGGSLETALAIGLSTNYTVTVGAGGAAGVAGANGNPGSNSVFSTITSTGGGYGGGNWPTAEAGGPGGSGGGSNGSSPTAAAGGTRTASPVQGFNGGVGFSGNTQCGGGGGGAGAIGKNGGSGGEDGDGGNGLATSITGSSVTYAGGGGAGNYGSGNVTIGGTGGGAPGGSGDSPYVSGVAATVNTGGGGGGASGDDLPGGAGGRGVVILRWLTSAGSITVGAGLTADSTGTDGSYSYKRFTDGSGNVSFA